MVNCPHDYVGQFFALTSPMEHRQFFSKYPVDEWTFDSYLQYNLKRKVNDLGQILHKYKEDLQWVSSYSTLPNPIKGFVTNLKKEITAMPSNRFKEKYTRSRSQDKPHVVTHGPVCGPMLIGSELHGSVHSFASSEASSSSTGSISIRSNDTPAEEQREGEQPQEANEITEEVTSLLATDDSASLQPISYHQKLTRWMFDLIQGKQTDAPRKRPVFADSSNAERLEHLTHGLLRSFSRNNDLDMCTLRLSLSYLVNFVEQDMKKVSTTVLGAAASSSLEDVPPIKEISGKTEIIALVDKICEPLNSSTPNAKEALINIARMKVDLLLPIPISHPYDSLQLAILDIYEYIIKNVDRWAKMNDNPQTSEADFICEVYPIIQFLIRNYPNIQKRSGEITAAATKVSQDDLKKAYGVEAASNTYGRKIDMIMTHSDMTTALCAIEWKKRYIPDRQILFQQAKNFRVNKCILRHILGLPLFEEDLIDSFILAMDFKGFTGYMFRLDKKDDVFVANLISKLPIPLHLRLIPSFKSTLLHLITWTEHMVKLSHIVEAAIQKKNADDCFDSITTPSTKRTPDPTEFTYLSPKRSKA